MAAIETVHSDNEDSEATDECTCPVCNVTCTQRCSSCRKVSYCCKEHQKSDWKNHKPECFPATIKYNDRVGRHLVTTRDIQIGEIILKEKPLACGPKTCGKSGQHFFPICLACFRIVSTHYCCSKCKWPVCNAQCELAPSHSQNECVIFRNQNITPSFKLISGTRAYDKIIILRALLCKESQPKAWSKIAALEAHSEARSGSPEGIMPTLSAFQFIQSLCGLKQFSYEDVDQVVGSLETNVFGNDASSIRPSSVHYRSSTYLYFFASISAHDCQPNAAWTIQTNSEFHLKATVRIPCGESITNLYSPVTIGTLSRRKHLKDSKHFDCSCLRCQDPYELGTNFSSIKCSHCKEGYLVPVNPLDPSSDWSCKPAFASGRRATATCGKTELVQHVENLISDIMKEIGSTINSVGGYDAPSIIKCVANLRQLVTKYDPSVLHTKHYLIFDIETIIIQKVSYFFSAPSISSTLTQIKIQDKLDLAGTMVVLSRKCLETANVILPGYSILRGRLLYFLQQGLTVKLHLTLSSNQNDKLSKSVAKEYRKELQELETARQESIQIFNYEPEGREEHSLHKIMVESSDHLRFVQNKLAKKNP